MNLQDAKQIKVSKLVIVIILWTDNFFSGCIFLFKMRKTACRQKTAVWHPWVIGKDGKALFIQQGSQLIKVSTWKAIKVDGGQIVTDDEYFKYPERKELT